MYIWFACGKLLTQKMAFVYWILPLWIDWSSFGVELDQKSPMGYPFSQFFLALIIDDKKTHGRKWPPDGFEPTPGLDLCLPICWALEQPLGKPTFIAVFYSGWVQQPSSHLVLRHDGRALKTGLTVKCSSLQRPAPGFLSKIHIWW